MGRTAQHAATGDRDATEQSLEEAALALMERDGVLAGLNLQAVADAAGVNRGLVYHYFGSRRELLRRALHRHSTSSLEQGDKLRELHGSDRGRALLRGMIKYPRAAKLLLLLAIDGDRTFTMTGDPELGAPLLERDIAEGRLASDVDFAALSTITMSFVCAYAVRRRSFAREFKLPVAELDRRVEELFVRMLDGLRP